MKIPSRFREDTIDGKTPIFKTINNGLMVKISISWMPKTRGKPKARETRPIAGPCETSLDRLVSRPARYRCGGLVVSKLHMELLPEGNNHIINCLFMDGNHMIYNIII